jgi:hypothetical protein
MSLLFAVILFSTEISMLRHSFLKISGFIRSWQHFKCLVAKHTALYNMQVSLFALNFLTFRTCAHHVTLHTKTILPTSEIEVVRKTLLIPPNFYHYRLPHTATKHCDMFDLTGPLWCRQSQQSFQYVNSPYIFPSHYMFRPLRAIFRWDIQLDILKGYL